MADIFINILVFSHKFILFLKNVCSFRLFNPAMKSFPLTFNSIHRKLQPLKRIMQIEERGKNKTLNNLANYKSLFVIFTSLYVQITRGFVNNKGFQSNCISVHIILEYKKLRSEASEGSRQSRKESKIDGHLSASIKIFRLKDEKIFKFSILRASLNLSLSARESSCLSHHISSPQSGYCPPSPAWWSWGTRGGSRRPSSTWFQSRHFSQGWDLAQLSVQLYYSDRLDLTDFQNII